MMEVSNYMKICVEYMSKTTILVETATRRLLKQLGRKEQTYDALINELICKARLQNWDPLDEGMQNTLSSDGSH